VTIGLLDLVKSTTLSVHKHLLVNIRYAENVGRSWLWWVFPFSLLRVQRRAILFVLKANRSLHVVVGLGYLFLLWFCTLLCSCNSVRDDRFFFIGRQSTRQFFVSSWGGGSGPGYFITYIYF